MFFSSRSIIIIIIIIIINCSDLQSWESEKLTPRVYWPREILYSEDIWDTLPQTLDTDID